MKTMQFWKTLLTGAGFAVGLPASPEIEALFAKMQAAYSDASTMSVDFSYTVKSDTRNQEVVGQARLMKPNLARLTYSRVAEHAFPNLIGSDGKFTYTYVPKNFRGGRYPDTTPLNPEFRVPSNPDSAEVNLSAGQFFAPLDRIPTNRTFDPAPHDPVLYARRASGQIGGGRIETERTRRDGHNLRLWDSIAIQSFFSFRHGISHLYQFQNYPENLTLEDPRVLEGQSCHVLSYYFADGNIEGGAKSPFTHRIYIRPDGFIVRYELHFVSNGQPGLQVMSVRNIRVNEPMTPESFAFTPPAD
jgi:outer membrane lipoprotein-sorting protein